MEEDKIEISPEELELVRDIFKTLSKSIKTLNVYPKGNPIYQKFVSDLFEKFKRFFESHEELLIEVRHLSLFYKDNEVFTSDERTDNIALLLFADGIRQITFHNEITQDEVSDFIEILRSALKSKADEDDDIVTLLWEKNIRNMGYSAVEDTVDDDLAVEEGLFTAERSEEVGEETTVGDASFQWRPETGTHQVASDPLSEAEIKSLTEEISGMNQESIISSGRELFFELLSNDPNTDSFPEIALSVGKILEIEIQRKDIKSAVEILTKLNALHDTDGDQRRNQVLGEILARAADPERLKIVIESSTSAELKEYLSLLGAGSVPVIIGLLGETQDRRQRKLLCEVLAEKGSVDSIGEALNDERWYLVRNLIMVLGMTREQSAIKYIGKTLRHPDVRVRREIIRALDNIHADDTKPLFASMLNDGDLNVRIGALKALRRFRDSSLFEIVKGIAGREDLKKKSFAEKKELLETLALLGGDSAFDLLSELFRKKWLLEKDEVTELRAAAAFGLGLIGTPQAQSLLEKETSSRKTILRDACLKSLKGTDGKFRK